jgi:hypothetical protein
VFGFGIGLVQEDVFDRGAAAVPGEWHLLIESGFAELFSVYQVGVRWYLVPQFVTVAGRWLLPRWKVGIPDAIWPGEIL